MRIRGLFWFSTYLSLTVPAWSAAPDAPENLRSTAYSETAGELFWARAKDDGIVVGYDIVRNGESLGVLDVLSLFQENLLPGVAYAYEVTAVDDDGERSPTVTTTLNTGEVDNDDRRPDKPELRFDVYSKTAAEIFWNRAGDDGLVIGYEITRNDKSIGTLDALSLFVDDMAPGTVYRFSIAAIDDDGNRSDPATIEFSTDDSSPPGASIPSRPTNLTAQVYSATAAELFWNRANESRLTYEISRLGLAQVRTDGTSFFDDELAREIQSYTYTVVTVNSDGLASKPARITIDTSDYAVDSGNDVGINASNYLEVLSTVFDVFNGYASGYGKAILDAPEFSNSRYVGPPNIVSSPEGPPQPGPPETVGCSNGGTAVFTPWESGLNEVTRGWNAEFDNCQDDATLFDGQFTRLTDFSQRRSSNSGFSVTAPARATRFTGSLEWKFAVARGDAFSRYWRMDDLSYTIEEGGQPLFELRNANTILSIARPLFRRLTGSFSLRWQLSDGTVMSIGIIGDMEQDIVDREEATFDGVMRYDSGSLQINANDSSELFVNASNGDPARMDISLTTNGVTETFTQNWGFLAPMQLQPLRLPYD